MILQLNIRNADCLFLSGSHNRIQKCDFIWHQISVQTRLKKVLKYLGRAANIFEKLCQLRSFSMSFFKSGFYTAHFQQEMHCKAVLE